MRHKLVSKILSGGIAAAVAFGAFSPLAFAEKTRLHEVLESRSNPLSQDEFKQLVSSHPEWVNEKDESGCTPLYYAVLLGGRLETVRCLVEHGADVNCVNTDGWTPLRLAARLGPFELVKYLVEHGADVNCKDVVFGHTPLWTAIRFGYPDVVRCLVEHGADVNCKDVFGHTPLALAKSKSLIYPASKLKDKAKIVAYLEFLGAKE